jgi:hypothetical protein
MSRTSRVLLAGATVALAAGLVPLGAAGAVGGPAGNNGTVKIDGEDIDIAPDNQPHVGCNFRVDWYGFDQGAVSDVEFALQPPSGWKVILTDRVTLDQGANADNTGGGSEAGWDGSAYYDLKGVLAGAKENPNQGYHVKLTINTQPTAQGADVKHKVFWVQGCEIKPS